MTSFSQMAEDTKSAIDSAQTNKQFRKILVSIADSTTRFANSLKFNLASEASGWLNPITWLKEFYAPAVAMHVNEWQQVEAALKDLRSLIEHVPNDDEMPWYQEEGKQSCLSALATVQTVYQFRSNDSAQLNKALDTLGGDIARLPIMAVKLIGAAIEIPANALLNQAKKTIWQMLIEFVKASWWLFLLAAIFIGVYISVIKAGGLTGMIAKAA
jgi:hypothetical protein